MGVGSTATLREGKKEGGKISGRSHRDLIGGSHAPKTWAGKRLSGGERGGGALFSPTGDREYADSRCPTSSLRIEKKRGTPHAMEKKGQIDKWKKKKSNLCAFLKKIFVCQLRENHCICRKNAGAIRKEKNGRKQDVTGKKLDNGHPRRNRKKKGGRRVPCRSSHFILRGRQASQEKRGDTRGLVKKKGFAGAKRRKGATARRTT